MKRYVKTNYEKAIDRFLSSLGFDYPYYPYTIYSYNTSEEFVVAVSFTDGITTQDYGIIKRNFELEFPDADIYLSKKHKDSSDTEDLWLEVEFEFSNTAR